MGHDEAKGVSELKSHAAAAAASSSSEKLVGDSQRQLYDFGGCGLGVECDER